MTHSLRFAALLLSCLALPPATAAAQCQPDGLDGTSCCTVADLKLPVFPVVFQEALDICWRRLRSHKTRLHRPRPKMEGA